MLPKSYEFWMDNQSGAAVTCTLTITEWKFDTSTGALVYGTPFTKTITDLADATSAIIESAKDNSTDLYLGAHVTGVFSGAGASGEAYVYYCITPPAGSPELSMLIMVNPAVETTPTHFQAEI